jgi:hypothetical protein
VTVPTREIRHQLPARTVNVLDGQALAKGIDRGELIARILGEYVDALVHESRMVLKFDQGNGSASGAARNGSE